MSNSVAKTPLEIGEQRGVSVSIGAAVWVPPSGETGGDVVKRAGDALGQAKKNGHGEIAVDGENGSIKPAPAKPTSVKPPPG
jgi:GGDEF domain-containing protein